MKAKERSFQLDIKKFTKQDVGSILRHITRADRHGRPYFNSNIDESKIKYDHRLDGPTSPWDAFEDQIRREDIRIYGPNRKDRVYLADVVFQVPEELKDASYEEQERFLKVSSDFFKQKFCGLDGNHSNLIGCWAHYSETTPHAHFAFIPLAKVDPKSSLAERGYKYDLNANKVLSPRVFRSLHVEYQEFLNKHGFTCRITNGVTKKRGGNLEISTLKAISSLMNISEFKQIIEEKAVQNQRISETLETFLSVDEKAVLEQKIINAQQEQSVAYDETNSISAYDNDGNLVFHHEHDYDVNHPLDF